MKIFAFVLCLMLCLPILGLSEEALIVNRISDPNAPSPFSEDATLLEVYFPKIDGVDSAFVRYGEYTMLIDCAGQQWEAVDKLLDFLSVTHLTYAVNSHPDADHIGGFHRVLRDVPADVFIYGFPEDAPDSDAISHTVYKALHELNIPMQRAVDGETLPFGDVNVTVYQLQDQTIPRFNNRSVMLKIVFGERSILFTGDIQAIAQQMYIALADSIDLSADIIKFPHHGYGRFQQGFLDMVSPGFVIVTNAQIDDAVRNQLKTNNLRYALTSMGILRLTTDGSAWLIERIK